MRRQHCSSLCSQSEGGEGCGDSIVAHFARKVRGGEGWGDSTVAHFARKVRGAKVAAIALAIFATCSSPSLCEQSELQCFAPVPRRQEIRYTLNSLLRRPRPTIKYVVMRRQIYLVVPPQSIFTTFRTSPPHFLKNPITPRPTALSLSFIFTEKPQKTIFPQIRN